MTDIYKVGKELGRGAFAVVKEATHKSSGRKYAVKIIDRNAMGDSNELSMQREIEIMKQVDHPNIILLRQVNFLSSLSLSLLLTSTCVRCSRTRSTFTL